MSLQGDLGELQIGELLQTLTLNNHEGTLKIASEKEGDRYFYLSKGEIQLVSQGKKGIRIGDALLKAGKVTAEDLEKAVRKQEETGTKIGEALVALEIITEEDIEGVVHQQFREEFFEIFLLTKGHFEFHFRTKPDQLVQFDESASRVSVNTSSLMLEALRQIDEWQVMSKVITTPRAILRVESDDIDAAIEEIGPAEDVKKAVGLIDGKSTVAEIVEKTPATKFDVYNLLYKLMEAQAIRALTKDECATAALGAEVGADTYAATQFYEFGTFLDPDDVELREKQFKLLKRLAVYKEAKEAALAIADRKLEAKELDKALEYYREAQACDERDLRAAEGIFRSSLLLGDNVQRSAKAGDEYVRSAIRHHDVKKAREALAALIDLEQFVHRRRIQLAELQEDDREGRAEAVRLLDEAIAGLTRPEDAALKAEAARKLIALDVRRQDAQASLKEAVGVQEDSHRKRVRNLVLANVAGAVLILFAYVGSKELAARKAYSEAEQIGATANTRDDVFRATYLFESIHRDFPWSTVVAKADAAAVELKERQKQLAAEEEERRKRAEALKSASAEQTKKDRAIELLKKGEAAEKRGDYRAAAEAKLDLVRDFGDVHLDQRVRVPIPIATEPTGAKVTVPGEDPITTPGVIYVEPFKPLRVKVELRGFLTRELAFKADKFEEASLKLERSALWTFKAGAAIEAGLEAEGGRIFVTARDGEIYALDGETGERVWKRKLAEYGDRISAPGFGGGKAIVGTTEGEVQALDPATGSTLWTFQAGGAVRERVTVSREGSLLAIGCGSGLAHFLNPANGAAVFSHKAEGRIEAQVAWGPGRAYVASRDRSLTALDAASGKAIWTSTAPDELLAAPLVLDDAVVIGARDGSVHALGVADGKAHWSVATAGRIRCPPVKVGPTSIAVASEDGTLSCLDARTGAGLWQFKTNGPIVATPVLTPAGIYVAATSGTIFRVDPAKGTSDWKFVTGSSILASPAVANGKLYVGGVDGVVRAVLE